MFFGRTKVRPSSDMSWVFTNICLVLRCNVDAETARILQSVFDKNFSLSY
jgi:hypothetical protein